VIPVRCHPIVCRFLAASSLFVGTSCSYAQAVYAPYLDVTLYPTPQIDQIGIAHGIQQFTLAFVVSDNGCVPSWGGIEPIGHGASSEMLRSLDTSIANYRARGGEIAISFGGAGGVPLMQACQSVPALKSAYQTVIDTYHLTHLDLDIEGPPLAELSSVNRSFQAIAQLQKDYAAQGKPLHVTLTLPAMPTGLIPSGVAVLDAAIANHATLDAVNIMAMDYGSPDLDMGASAISAAQALYSQLDTAFKSAGQPKTNAELWQLVGVTPMIGVNDVAKETFTLDNTQSLVQSAQNNLYGFVANWSEDRDQSCPDHATYPSPTCSGIDQAPYAFAARFTTIKGHWGKGFAPAPNYTAHPPRPRPTTMAHSD